MRLLPWSPRNFATALSMMALNLVAVTSAVAQSTAAAESTAVVPFDKPKRLASIERPFNIRMKVPPQPSTDHNLNKTLDLSPLAQPTISRLSTGPIRLEATYNECISLEDALNHALLYNLPIKINRESYNYQKYQLLGAYSGFVPSFGINWTIARSSILPNPTIQNSRLYSATVSYPVFAGGSTVYNALSQYYRKVGFYYAYNASVNDALLDVYNKYTNLVLNICLLEIRANALQLSETQLKMNTALYEAGTGTQFAIMQSRTQLGEDRQALIQQQQTTRFAAMDLAYALNLPMSINLVPMEAIVTENPIIDSALDIKTLMNLAVLYRPELRQFECFRLSAARSVQQTASSLYPSLAFFTGFTHASVTVNPPQNAGEASGIATAEVANLQDTAGQVSNQALNQTAAFTPENDSTSNSADQGANTAATTVVASSGGNPISAVQSGGLVTSGAVAPTFGGTSGVSVGATNTAGAGVFAGLANTNQAGYGLTWGPPNLGISSIFSIVATRALSRQSMLQANQELMLVSQQVRTAFVNATIARQKIDAAAYGVSSAGDALKLANLRVRTGLGTNLELIQAQRDYITALTNQAQAIIASNQAQAQLLHDTGLISVGSLVKGYRVGDLPGVRKERGRKT